MIANTIIRTKNGIFTTFRLSWVSDILALLQVPFMIMTLATLLKYRNYVMLCYSWKINKNKLLSRNSLQNRP